MTMRIRALIVFVLLATSVQLISAQEPIEHLALEIDLGGFVTDAELTYPANADGPFPTVILFHGSGPYDMDATVMLSSDSEPRSANFQWLAENLPEQGIAVLRFNKRGVLGNGEYDFAQVQLSYSPDQLVADAQVVIDTALELPEVGDVYLYGWSEGAWIVTNAASAREDISGLILQGGLIGDLSNALPYQHLENGLTFLSETVDANADGALDIEEVLSIPEGYPASLMPSFYMWAYTSSPENPQFNPMTDTNGDGLIDLETELRPVIEQTINNYGLFLGQVELSYDLLTLVGELQLPTLLLHGEWDGWIPASNSDQIAEAYPEFVTAIIYPELGHALSLVESPTADIFGEMEPQVLEDIVAWVSEQE